MGQYWHHHPQCVCVGGGTQIVCRASRSVEVHTMRVHTHTIVAYPCTPACLCSPHTCQPIQMIYALPLFAAFMLD